uniref:Fowlpox virus genomic DNA, 11.2 kb-long BamHI-fragment with twenty open reading frames n=1 Tax=Fowlpox virus TaxID=10261 RepID=Q9YPJ9_FOWPV|nr:unnamed protein product [Fowlpox virus]
MKGTFAFTIGIFFIPSVVHNSVTLAASVPYSSTFITDFCLILPILKVFVSDIPTNSPDLNRSLHPIWISASFKSTSSSNSNLGK